MDKELLYSLNKKDFKLDWFSGTGAGGQHRNKHMNCCRITHLESGAVGSGQDSRSRVSNQRDAFNTLVCSKTMQKWLRIQNARALGNMQAIEKEINSGFKEEDLKIEIKNKVGQWVTMN